MPEILREDLIERIAELRGHNSNYTFFYSFMVVGFGCVNLIFYKLAEKIKNITTPDWLPVNQVSVLIAIPVVLPAGNNATPE